MNTSERIHALEGLLARIQKNAALPRPPRGSAAVPPPMPASSLADTVPGLMPPLAATLPSATRPAPAPKAPAPAPKPPEPVRPTSLRAEYAKPTGRDLPALVKTVPFGQPSLSAAPRATGELGRPPVKIPSAPPPGSGLLELDMDDELLRGAVVPVPATRRGQPLQDGSLEDVDVLFDDEPTLEAREERDDDEARRQAEADEWRRLEEEARRIEAEEARAARELHERIAARKAEEERLAREAAEQKAAEGRRAEAEQLAREAAAKAEEERASARKAEEERLAREAAAKAEAERKAEAARLAREAAEKAEAQRVTAQKAEEERLAREAAERAEAQRVAAQKAEEERLAREAAAKAEAARRAEEERLARGSAAKAEASRVAAQKAEEERLARALEEELDAARAAEEERLRREEAARVEREVEERAALAAAAQLEREEELRVARELAAAASEAASAPPASARQPKDELRPIDAALPGLDDEEEQPPESGEVGSQRKPTLLAEVAFPAEEAPSVQVRILAEPGPPAAFGPVAPVVVEVTADVASRRPFEGDATSFLGAVRAERVASFGELLDAALSLGS